MEPIKKRRASSKKAALATEATPETQDPTQAPTPRADERPFIVGIGASAGGLEALSQLFPNLPKNLGLTYVVVQHLSPTYDNPWWAHYRLHNNHKGYNKISR